MVSSIRFESPPKLKGPLSQNKKLQAVEKLFEGLLIGPESFASGENGTSETKKQNLIY